MKKQRGFVFIETIVTIVILATALLSIYSIFSNLVTKQKRYAYYDDPLYIFRANYLGKIFLDQYINLTTYEENPDLNLELMDLLNDDVDCATKGTCEFIKGFSCRNDVFSTADLKTSCDNFFSDNSIYRIYIAKYDLSKVKECSIDTSKTGSACSEFNSLSNQAKNYIKSLAYVPGAKGYYLIFEFKDESSSCNANPDSCMHYFASVKVGGENSAIVFDDNVKATVFANNATISIPNTVSNSDYTLKTISNLYTNGSFEGKHALDNVSSSNSTSFNLSNNYSIVKSGLSSIELNGSLGGINNISLDFNLNGLTSGNSYYARINVNSDTSGTLIAGSSSGSYNGGNNIFTPCSVISNDVSNKVQFVSSVPSSGTSYIDDLIVVDLNDIFGNNIPDITWLDSNLPFISDSIKMGYTETQRNSNTPIKYIITPDSGYYYSGKSCSDSVATYNVSSNELTFNNLSFDVSCEVYFTLNNDISSNFDYTGGIQTFTAPKTGFYHLETWGAQGGSYDETYHGGFGGYSSGYTYLNSGDILYVVVGGAGKDRCLTNNCAGGYNGGGGTIYYSGDQSNWLASGGGATHIAYSTGVLSSLENRKDDLIMVAGGGGGAYYWSGTIRGYTNADLSSSGGSGGGYQGVTGPHVKYVDKTSSITNKEGGGGGTQSAGGSAGYRGENGSFGQGGTGGPDNSSSSNENRISSGGGGGYYGGGSSAHTGTGGGSGFASSKYLFATTMNSYGGPTNMYGKNLTISSDNYCSDALSNVPKAGNGYARITYVDGSKEYTVTSKFSDSFENTSGWTFSGNAEVAGNQTSGNHGYSNNVISKSGVTGLYFSGAGWAYHSVSFVEGHKYYIQLSAKKETNSILRIATNYVDSSGGHSATYGYATSSGWLDVNTHDWKDYYAIVSPSKYNGNLANSLQIGCSSSDTCGKVKVDDINVVDLTSIFGGGNEPSLEWCHKNLGYFYSKKLILK